jgi:hypothetical protein
MLFFGSLLSRSTRTSARRHRRPPTASRRRQRPGLEVLEDRTAPALFLVNALTDTNPAGGGVGSGNAGDLRFVLTHSNGAGGTNTIDFQPGLSGTILVHALLPKIDSNLSLNGPVLSSVVVNGNRLGSVFDVAAGNTVSISNLSITGGKGSRGGGILNNRGATLTVSNCIIAGNSAAMFGGGVFNGGTLTVSSSLVVGNLAVAGGGGIMNFGAATVSDSTVAENILRNSGQSQGGGINNNGTLTLSNSTIWGCFAQFGGGLLNSGTTVVSNSTIANNSARFGGGVANEGTLVVLNSTITGNSVSGFGAMGGGIFEPAFGRSITLHDTIVAGNAARNGARGPDFAGTVKPSVLVVIAGVTYNEGFNLIGDGTGSKGFTNGLNGDQVGTARSPISARLGVLENNGGPTRTLALLPGSPAINAGDPNNTASLPAFDQRGFGFPRIVANRVDIGAIES